MTLPLLAALLPLFALQTQEEEKYDHGHVYRLPYEGKSRRVSQASNGVTHKGKSAHAIDFSMPRKTRIIAARAGVVTRVVERHEELSKAEKKELRERGKQPKANTVTIRHEDGSRAIYAHLQEEGIEVEKGQNVKAGDFLGYSGNTGKSSGPHLHFCVYASKGKGSVHVKFRTSRSGETFLDRGTRYRNATEY